MRRAVGPATDNSPRQFLLRSCPSRGRLFVIAADPPHQAARERKRSTPMTSAEELSANTDYETTIHVTAPPDAVFDALTTTSGLAAWWNPATGSGERGGE